MIQKHLIQHNKVAVEQIINQTGCRLSVQHKDVYRSWKNAVDHCMTEQTDARKVENIVKCPIL